MTAIEYVRDKVASYTRLSDKYKKSASLAPDQDTKVDSAARANVFEMAAEEFENVLELLAEESKAAKKMPYMSNTVQCKQCGKVMHNVGANRKYCQDCAAEIHKANMRQLYHERYAKRKRSHSKKKPPDTPEQRDADFVAENQRLEALGGSYGKGRLKEYLAAQNKKPSGAGNTGWPAKG